MSEGDAIYWLAYFGVGLILALVALPFHKRLYPEGGRLEFFAACWLLWFFMAIYFAREWLSSRAAQRRQPD